MAALALETEALRALTGAIAAQCTYQIDPSKYVDFRSAVYKNQATITGGHARDQLLHIAAEVGVDNLKLAACIDTKDSLPRVEAEIRRGTRWGLHRLQPALSMGRTLIGGPAASDFYKLIDEAMHESK